MLSSLSHVFEEVSLPGRSQLCIRSEVIKRVFTRIEDSLVDHILLHGVRMPGGDTTGSSGSQQAPSPLPATSNERISQLKPPGGLDFDSMDLSQAWKRWSEEIKLYMDLAMVGKDEKTKVKLFLYIIGRAEKYMKLCILNENQMSEH